MLYSVDQEEKTISRVIFFLLSWFFRSITKKGCWKNKQEIPKENFWRRKMFSENVVMKEQGGSYWRGGWQAWRKGGKQEKEIEHHWRLSYRWVFRVCILKTDKWGNWKQQSIKYTVKPAGREHIQVVRTLECAEI